MKAVEIAELLEELSPVRYSCGWDNVGMHVGRFDKEVKKIIVSLDIDDRTVAKAVETGADMIVSHHPLLFNGIKQINDKDFIGKRVITLIENGINGYCMHTNFDSVGGMATEAADRMKLRNMVVLEEVLDGEGIGRVGDLEKEITVKELCEEVKKVFSLDKVVLYGNEHDVVKRAAISPGSGKSTIDLAVEKGATAIITGDITYHCGTDAVSKGINVIDAGHYGIEHIFIEKVGNYLLEKTKDVEVIKMKIDNPQKYI